MQEADKTTTASTPEESTNSRKVQVQVFEGKCDCGRPYQIEQRASKRRPYICECGRRFWWKKSQWPIAGVMNFQHTGPHILLTTGKFK